MGKRVYPPPYPPPCWAPSEALWPNPRKAASEVRSLTACLVQGVKNPAPQANPPVHLGDFGRLWALGFEVLELGFGLCKPGFELQDLGFEDGGLGFEVLREERGSSKPDAIQIQILGAWHSPGPKQHQILGAWHPPGPKQRRYRRRRAVPGS